LELKGKHMILSLPSDGRSEPARPEPISMSFGAARRAEMTGISGESATKAWAGEKKAARKGGF
jgi:hypothetical protein